MTVVEDNFPMSDLFGMFLKKNKKERETKTFGK